MFSPFSCSTFSNCPVAFNTTGSQRHGKSPVSDTIGIPKSQFCPLVSCTMGNFSKMPNFALSHFKRKQDVFLSKIAFQKIGGFRIFTARKRKTTASQFFPAVRGLSNIPTPRPPPWRCPSCNICWQRRSPPLPYMRFLWLPSQWLRWPSHPVPGRRW